MKKQKINKLSIFTKLFYMFFFALVFVVIGRFLPEIYYQNFDNTNYYLIKTPVEVNKTEYKQNDTITLKFDRICLVNANATAFIELVLIDGENNFEILSDTRPLSLNNNPQHEIINIYFKLTEKIPCGNYFLRGTVYFKANNFDKNTQFYTNEFKIIN